MENRTLYAPGELVALSIFKATCEEAGQQDRSGRAHAHFLIVYPLPAVSFSVAFPPQAYPNLTMLPTGKRRVLLFRNFSIQSLDGGWLTGLDWMVV